MTELASRTAGRVRVAAATGPELSATATVDLLVHESDCANALHLSNDPRDDFPPVSSWLATLFKISPSQGSLCAQPNEWKFTFNHSAGCCERFRSTAL